VLEKRFFEKKKKKTSRCPNFPSISSKEDNLFLQPRYSAS